jgi:hypothetical protein
MDCAICYQEIIKVHGCCECRGTINYHQSCLINWVFREEIQKNKEFNTLHHDKSCDVCKIKYVFTIPTLRMLILLEKQKLESIDTTISINLEPITDISIKFINMIMFIICILNILDYCSKYCDDYYVREKLFFPS